MNEHGSFSGNPKTEWLVYPDGVDRDMRIIEDFWYQDPDDRIWKAPAGSIVDGASIPRPLWAYVGSPYTGDYRCASIVHDVACADPAVDRRDADAMFYHACRAGGCPAREAIWLYMGVRLGSWSRWRLPDESIARDAALFGVPFAMSPEAQSLQDDFRAMAVELDALPDEASTHEIDAFIEERMNF